MDLFCSLPVFMYLTEKYLEILQNVDVEEPKPSQHKNGKVSPLLFTITLHAPALKNLLRHLELLIYFLWLLIPVCLIDFQLEMFFLIVTKLPQPLMH